MILTCPECATRYVAPDGSIGPAGRSVRCANCGKAWRATPEADEDVLELEPAEPSPAAAEAQPQPQPEAALEAAPEPDLDVPTAQLSGEDLPKVFRRRVKAKAENRKAAASGAVFGLTAAALIALLGLLAISRESVVRAWPKTASAYAWLKMPVNATGLAIEHTPTAEIVDGRPAIVVRGSLRNVEDHEVPVPPLKITLLDKNGETLRTKLSQAPNLRVPAGATRYFEESVLDPPGTVSDVEVSFALDGPTEVPAKGDAKAQRPAQAKPAAPTAPLRHVE